jgi:hypothetical protein
MLNTILQERFTMANLIKNANLEIEKARAISDRRLEGLRKFKMISGSYGEKVRALETALGQFSQQLGGNSQYTSLVSLVGSTLGEFRTLAGNDVSITVYEQEPVVYLGDIYGDNEVSVRLQSLLRESQYTINALRDKLIEVGKANSNVKFEDQSRTIEFLRLELSKTSEELSRLRNNVPVSSTPLVQSSSSTPGADVRALQARNQELEAQLRGIKLEYENKIRQLNTQIETLESENRTLRVRVDQKGTTSTNFGSPNYQEGELNTPGRAGYSYNQTTPSSSASSQNVGSYNRPSNVPQSGTAVRTTQQTTTSQVGGSTLTNSGSYAARTSGTQQYGSSSTTSYGATGTTSYGATGAGLSGSRTAQQGANLAGSSNLSSSGSFRAAGSSSTSYGATGATGTATGTTYAVGSSGLSASRTAQGATYTASSSSQLSSSRGANQGSASYNFRQ